MGKGSRGKYVDNIPIISSDVYSTFGAGRIAFSVKSEFMRPSRSFISGGGTNEHTRASFSKSTNNQTVEGQIDWGYQLSTKIAEHVCTRLNMLEFAFKLTTVKS
jgi:hypothetical protein